jgi:predicted MFS family arabinose efflux permease
VRTTSGLAGWLRARTGGQPRDVWVLGVIAFCVAVGFGVLVPVLPVFARTFGVGNFEVGAVISPSVRSSPHSR